MQQVGPVDKSKILYVSKYKISGDIFDYTHSKNGKFLGQHKSSNQFEIIMPTDGKLSTSSKSVGV